MKNFEQYLNSVRIDPMNQIPYYVSWVSRFFSYHSKKPGDAVNPKEIDIFTHYLSKIYEEWQVSELTNFLTEFKC